MLEKDLTKLTILDLWKEYNNIWNSWQKEEAAVKDFRRMFIEGALESEPDMIVGCKSYERRDEGRLYRNEYWNRWLILNNIRLDIRMPRIRGLGYESGIIPKV